MTIQQTQKTVEQAQAEFERAKANLELAITAACERILAGTGMEDADPFGNKAFASVHPIATSPGRFSLSFSELTEEQARAAVLAVWPEAAK